MRAHTVNHYRATARAIAVLVSVMLSSTVQAERVASTAATDSVPLWSGLGDHRHPITTRSPLAQRYFEQGLNLAFAFNHPDAVRSFRKAQELDGDCAMCYWGEAFALGPNINMLMDSASGVAAYSAAQRAQALADRVTPMERAYIRALVVRYSTTPMLARKSLDSAYARAMANVARSYPRDVDAAVLYAESEMLLGPWDYWLPGKQAKPHGARAVAALTQAVARDPRHAGACHYYIHAVEAAYPARAVACAERLPTLMPGAGHVVHMPGHIYIRVGRYADAIARNIHALHADEEHIADMPADGVYRLALHPHNAHFLAFAASMIGRSAEALDAARQTRAKVDTSMLRAPGLGALQHYYMLPTLVMVRFARWDDVLAQPEPAEDLPYPRALRHYARVLAFAARGEPDKAQQELKSLHALRADERVKSVTLWDINSAASLLDIAELSAEAELAAAKGDVTGALALLQRAVAREDALTYDEPPPWHLPVRQQLGDRLLRAGRAREAEAAFRRDLERHPNNGWSLAGLAASLRALGRRTEATAVDGRFRRAWATADIPAPSFTAGSTPR
jgi:tetratricopeptide (TPR) repeat protein